MRFTGIFIIEAARRSGVFLEGVGDVPDSSSQGVFLSYRREDAGPYARNLQLQLSQRIPDARIFMDMDSIEAGLDFADRKSVV